jgi:hypothetical protein
VQFSQDPRSHRAIHCLVLQGNPMLLLASCSKHAFRSNCTRMLQRQQHSTHSTGTLTNRLTADSSKCVMQMAQGVAVETDGDARPARLPPRPIRLPRNAKAAAAIAISAHVEDHNV